MSNNDKYKLSKHEPYKINKLYKQVA